MHTKITFWNLIQLRQCIVFQKYLLIFRQNFFEKKNCHSSNMASNFVRESIFVYDNPITQIDSISLVHAMVQAYHQSHYREIPRWGVSNGTRHNWKCFLAYKRFEVFFTKFYMLLIHQNVPHLSDSDNQKHFWGIWWFHRSKNFEAMKAGKSAIWPISSPNLNSCSIKIPHCGTSL